MQTVWGRSWIAPGYSTTGTFHKSHSNSGMPQQKIETQTQKKNASFADKAVLPTNHLLIVILKEKEKHQPCACETIGTEAMVSAMVMGKVAVYGQLM
mmetsp:Transcript_61320/g.121374  ORF Transcript_61320/g.121374 Transcript_61320/m.121374 type:complete len:97 (-) Transcript_61320:962-1252(-)